MRKKPEVENPHTKVATGRPKKELNKEQFEYLCSIQCTEEEIAGVFKCDVNTVNRWCNDTYGEGFSEVYKNHSANGKMSLRRLQFRMAEKSPAMAIWLGKQYLGQTDKIDQQIISIDANVRDKVNASIKRAQMMYSEKRKKKEE